MERFQLRSQLENNIVRISILESVYGIRDEDNAAGAQPERRGDAGQAELQLGGETRRPPFLSVSIRYITMRNPRASRLKKSEFFFLACLARPLLA